MAFISSAYFDEGFQVVDLPDDVELEFSAFCEILPLSRYENKECLNGRELKTSKDVSESPSEAVEVNHFLKEAQAARQSREWMLDGFWTCTNPHRPVEAANSYKDDVD